MNEDQVKVILLRYGQLRSFHLVKDKNERNSKGYAFCEYADNDATDNAIKYLNGFKIQHRTLNVKRSGTGEA